MKLVIDIPEERYKDMQRIAEVQLERNHFQTAEQIIAYGTPLPKGHGRLIDADAFIARLEDASKRQQYKKLLIDDCLTVDDVFKAIIESLQNVGLANGDTPTIIEADKAESEEV